MQQEPESDGHESMVAEPSSPVHIPYHRSVNLLKGKGKGKAPRQEQPRAASPRQPGPAPPQQYVNPVQTATPAPAYYPTPPPSVPNWWHQSLSPYGYPLPPPPQPLIPWMPPPQQLFMTGMQARSAPPPTPAIMRGLGSAPRGREATKPDVESEQRIQRLRNELRSMRADSAKQHEKAQLRKLGEKVERRFVNRMEALVKTNEDSKREAERVREAAEVAAREWEVERRKAELERSRLEAHIKAQATSEERERIEAEKKAEKQRTQKEAAAMEEFERAVMARLQKEDSAMADWKQELERFERATRAKLVAECEAQAQATIEEASLRREQVAKELEARERKVFEAEIRHELTTELMTREKAAHEAEMMNKLTAEGLAREKALFEVLKLEAQTRLDSARTLQLELARERAIIDAKATYPYVEGAAWTMTDDLQSNHGHPADAQYWDQEDNRDDGGSDQVPELEVDSSYISHSRTTTQGRNLASGLAHPSNTISKDGASGARAQVDVDVVYNSATTRNMTVHLNLELSQDIDDELEEFSQLSRMGNFASAESFFDLHLRKHFSNASVFVQYADMLLEKGDFKALMSVDASSVFAARDSDGPQDLSSELDQLEMNWKLIRAIVLCYSQHTFHAILDVVKGLDSSWRAPGRRVGSTELRNLTLAIRLTKLLTRPHSEGFGRGRASDWADWKRIYRQLLSEDRIWDFRDAFIAVCTSYGTVHALEAFFDHPSPVEGLLLDWQTDSHDESTELALLDLLSFMALATAESPDGGHLTETCLHLAEPIGNSLLDNFPHAIRSRMFVQWVVAKSVVRTEKFNYLADYRGHAVFPEFETGMPYYIPVHQENPGWLPQELTPKARQSLEMALSTAREIHDYRTEARCLQELSLGTQDPSRSLQELAELQKSQQLDMAGYLATCLTKYLTCGDSETKRVLLEDLETFGPWEDSSDLVSPTLAAARDVIARALSLKSADDAEMSIEAALEFYPYVSQAFRRTIDSFLPRGPLDSNTGEGRSIKPSASISADEDFVGQKLSGKDQNTQSDNKDEVVLRVEDFEVSSDSSWSDESSDSDEFIFDSQQDSSVIHRRNSV